MNHVFKGSENMGQDIQVQIRVTPPYLSDEETKSDNALYLEMASLFRSIADSSSIRIDTNKMSDIETLTELPTSSLMDQDVTLPKDRYKPLIFGNQQKIEDFIENCSYDDEKYEIVWIMKALLAFARSFGQPLFLNNIISGIIILIGLSLENSAVFPVIIVSFFISFVTTKVISTSPLRIDSGEFYGPILYTTLYEFHIFKNLPPSIWNQKFYSIMSYFIGSKILMSIVQGGIAELFLRQRFPPLHTSFILLQWISDHFMNKMLSNDFVKAKGILLRDIAINVTFDSDNFGEIIISVVFGLSRIYFSSSRLLGALILVSISIFSISLTFDALFGIFFSAILDYTSPLLHAGNDLGQSILNSALVCMSVNFFFSLSLVTKMMSLLASPLVLFLQALIIDGEEMEDRAKAFNFGTLPFCIGFYIIYLAFDRNKYVVKVELNHIKFPEMHKRLFKRIFAIGDA